MFDLRFPVVSLTLGLATMPLSAAEAQGFYAPSIQRTPAQEQDVPSAAEPETTSPAASRNEVELKPVSENRTNFWVRDDVVKMLADEEGVPVSSVTLSELNLERFDSGAKEYIGTISDPAYCGSMGCPYLVLQDSGSGELRYLLEPTLGHRLIIEENQYSNDMKDLTFQTKTGDALWRFDGESYAHVGDPDAVAMATERQWIDEHGRAGIAYVQRRLNEMGYCVGRPDGVIGPKTRYGIYAWKATNSDMYYEGRIDDRMNESVYTWLKFMEPREIRLSDRCF